MNKRKQPKPLPVQSQPPKVAELLKVLAVILIRKKRSGQDQQTGQR